MSEWNFTQPPNDTQLICFIDSWHDDYDSRSTSFVMVGVPVDGYIVSEDEIGTVRYHVAAWMEFPKPPEKLPA